MVLESIFSFKANFFSYYLEHFKYMFIFINIETIYSYNQSPKSVSQHTTDLISNRPTHLLSSISFFLSRFFFF